MWIFDLPFPLDSFVYIIYVTLSLSYQPVLYLLLTWI